jgi:hypothetical protein
VRALPYADEARIHVFWMDDMWRGDNPATSLRAE